MNPLDKLVTWLSPVAGARRLAARQALRAYEGAKHGRKTAGWQTSGSSANTEVLPALPALRNRSRDLCRNNPWAKKAATNWVDDAIGTGIMLGIQAKHKAAKTWAGWALTKECDADGDSDLYGLQALAALTMWISGGVIIRRRWRRPTDGLSIPMQLQVLEPDYLDHNKNQQLATGYIVGGVEFDKIGRRVAFWLFDVHPGEAYMLGDLQSHRVPAEDVIYAYKKTRPGQLHGVPELAAVLLRLRDLDDYEDAEITRKKIEACFSVFVTSNDSANPSFSAPEQQPGKKGFIERIVPGIIKKLLPGESVSFAQPTPVAGYTDYMRQTLRGFAAGVGQTYEQVSGDLSQVNYSSYRAGQLSYRRSVEAWQWLVFIPQVCDRIVGWFNEAADLVGKPAVPTGYEWTTPKFEWVDPVKDMKGELLKVASGVQSFSELIRKLGSTPEKVLTELKADYERLRAAGIPISLDGLVALATAQDEPAASDPKGDGSGTT